MFVCEREPSACRRRADEETDDGVVAAHAGAVDRVPPGLVGHERVATAAKEYAHCRSKRGGGGQSTPLATFRNCQRPNSNQRFILHFAIANAKSNRGYILHFPDCQRQRAIKDTFLPGVPISMCPKPAAQLSAVRSLGGSSSNAPGIRSVTRTKRGCNQ